MQSILMLPVLMVVSATSAPAAEQPQAEWLKLGTVRRTQALFDALGEAPRRVETATARLRFVDVGTSAGEGEPPWLFVHGLGGSLGDWGPLLVSAAGRRRVLAFDLPGFGGSESFSRDYTIAAFARSLVDFLDAGGIDRAHLVCHSLGGQVCLAFALDRPERVATLTLIDSAGTYEPAAFLRGVSQRLGGVHVGRVDPARNAAIDAMTAGDRRIMQRIVGDDAFIFAALDSFSSNYRRRLHLLRVPLLVIWGELDPLFPVEDAFALKENIDGARLHIVDGAGHSPHASDPDHVLRFINQHHARWASTGPAEREHP